MEQQFVIPKITRSNVLQIVIAKIQRAMILIARKVEI
jgi:hypothetical protein